LRKWLLPPFVALLVESRAEKFAATVLMVEAFNALFLT
jgi:hypothetical protein